MRTLNRRLTIAEKLGQGLTRKEVALMTNGITRRGFVGGGMGLAGLAVAAGLRPGMTSAAALSAPVHN